MQSHADPRRPRAPQDDDAAPGLPVLDGAETDANLEAAVDLDVRDDEASALDDAGASELAGALDGIVDEAEGASSLGDDDRAAPVEADPTLASGESERWTEGSDASEDVPWEEPAAPEPTTSSLDRGEEGFDDAGAIGGDALPGLPPARAGEAGDEDAGELDLSDAGVLDTPGLDAPAPPPLPLADVTSRWHGPSREAAHAITLDDRGVLVAARGLHRIEPGTPGAIALPFDGEVASVLVAPGSSEAHVATDGGDVWVLSADGSATKLPRPGTDDASLGGLDLAALVTPHGVTLVARTRGGALFRQSDVGWTGPIVAKNVRRIHRPRTAGDWLTLVVGSASAPELMATRDARVFERVRGPEGAAPIDAAREGDLVAVASAGGALFVSRDAGATYARIDSVVDVERVWTLGHGVVLAATFHEATDHGRLVRVDGEKVEVILDVEAEAARHRLSGPGEHDGDGRIHALVVGRGAIFVATGLGVFELSVFELPSDAPA
jgi:hypothetical protein